jgi:SPP1 family predicted phage head-tail adaptor
VIGELRERVTLQSPLRTADGAGGANISWGEDLSVWAKVEQLGGDESVSADRLAAHARLRVTIRYRKDVTTEMRLLWRLRAYGIRALRDADGDKRFLVLDCEARV